MEILRSGQFEGGSKAEIISALDCCPGTEPGPDGAETCQFGLFWRLEKRYGVFGSAKAAAVLIQHEWQESAFNSVVGPSIDKA